MRNFMIK